MEEMIPKDLLLKFGIDESMALVVVISFIVISLFILIVVVASSMRVKFYKDKLTNTNIDNQDKLNQIIALQKSLDEYQLKNKNLEESLKSFEDTKAKLSHTKEELKSLDMSYKELKDLQEITSRKLDNLRNMYEKLVLEHHSLIAKFEAIQEDNSKLQVNNARLLRKLEQK